MKDQFGWEIEEPPVSSVPTDLNEMRKLWKKRIEVTQMNCPRCGLRMRFMPFCSGKAMQGFSGRFDCPGCRKHVFVSNEEWYERFG